MSSSKSHSTVSINSDGASENKDKDKDREDKDKANEEANRKRLTRLTSSFFEGRTEAQVGMWKIAHRQQKIKKTSIELILHLIFTIIFVIIISLQRYVYVERTYL